MSLFPAYASGENKASQVSDSEAGPSWLSNSTFTIPNEKTKNELSTTSESGQSDNEKRKKRSMHKTRKKHRNRYSEKKQINNEEDRASKLFYENSTTLESDKPKYNVPQVTLTKPVNNYSTSDKKNEKKKKKKRKTNKSRYFQKKLEEDKERTTSVTNPEPMNIQEFLKHTETFNRMLRNEPRNIKMWLDYIKLQDSGEGTLRGRGEKKLSILDRAIELNPNSDELLHQKMLILEFIFPMEKVGSEAKDIVAKYPKNLVGWQWLINSLQCNLSKMTAPGVRIMYEKVLAGIHKAHHDSEPFIDTLLQCGLFLRQCGLWEELWLVLQLYLELNLTTAGSGAFNVQVDLPDDDIQKLEDTVITSGLPLGSLWLRVERLREGFYFLPINESSDPQRVVFREDVSQLLFPVNQKCFSKLVMSILFLLKIPPLPLTEAFYRYSGLQKIPWSLDSVEIILAAKYSKGETRYLSIVEELLVGPQYLSKRPGQAEFFNFVNAVFGKCIAHCNQDNICFLIWQMRWWRWVYSIQNKADPESKDALKKTFLSKAKKLLKQHRECVILYVEYAYLEFEFEDFDSSINILETTIHLRDPPLMSANIERRDLCALYKVYIELLIKQNLTMYKEKILTALIALVFGEPLKNITLRDELITKCGERFNHVTTEVLRDVKDAPVGFTEVVLPDYCTSWIVLNAWFVFITDGIWESLTILEKAIETIDKCEKKNGHLVDVTLERLYEGLIDILSYHCFSTSTSYSTLNETLIRAIKSFPNNAFFLNILSACEISGIKWQRLSTDIISSGSVLASSLMFFMTHYQLMKGESLKVLAANRLQALLEKIKNNFDRCPLIWRLILQASSIKDSQDIKRVFYQALEKLPWVKLLYYETAKILPEGLPEIQDLLVEKELRLYITPEELDILREE